MTNKLSVKKLLITWTLAATSIVAAACGSQPTATIKAATQKPAVVQPTQAPAQPTQAPAKPTTAPVQPTTVKKPTEAPTTSTKPTMENPTAVPTTAAVQPTTAAITKIPLGKPQTDQGLSILPSKYEWLTESGADKPKSGDVYLLVTVSLENTDKTASIQFDPTAMQLTDASGQMLSTISLKSVSNELKAQTLKPGAKVEGVVVYEVPEKQQGDKWDLLFKGGDNLSLDWSLAG